jgi:hypothetical protein
VVLCPDGRAEQPTREKKKIIRRRRFLASRKRVPSTGNIPDPRGGNQRTWTSHSNKMQEQAATKTQVLLGWNQWHLKSSINQRQDHSIAPSNKNYADRGLLIPCSASLPKTRQAHWLTKLPKANSPNYTEPLKFQSQACCNMVRGT